jgi:hypothetical protein
MFQTWANKVATELPFLTIPTNTLVYQTNSKPLQRMTWREYGFGQENSLVTLGHTFFPGWLPVEKLGFVNLVSYAITLIYLTSETKRSSTFMAIRNFLDKPVSSICLGNFIL